MDRSRWWRNKAQIYASKIKADLDNRKRTKKVSEALLEVAEGLDACYKMFRDDEAHAFLVDLDNRLDAGDFPPAATKIITKCTI